MNHTHSYYIVLQRKYKVWHSLVEGFTLNLAVILAVVLFFGEGFSNGLFQKEPTFTAVLALGAFVVSLCYLLWLRSKGEEGFAPGIIGTLMSLAVFLVVIFLPIKNIYVFTTLYVALLLAAIRITAAINAHARKVG